MKIIPFYFVLKILFLIWMFLPGSNGCNLVYQYIILQMFKSIENNVDSFFEETRVIGSQVYKDTQNMSKILLQKTKDKGMQQMEQFSKSFIKLKGLAKAKKGDMSEAIKATQELEIEKAKADPLSGKEFFSALILPNRDEKTEKKDEAKLRSMPPIKEEKTKNEDKIKEEKNNNEGDNKKVENDDDDDDIEGKMDEFMKSIIISAFVIVFV